MVFTTIKNLVLQSFEGGREWATYFYKITGAFAYTAGRYYDLSMTLGNPRPNVYPGGLGDATSIDNTWKSSIFHPRMAVGNTQTTHIISAQAYSAVGTAVPSVLTLCDYLLFYPLIDCDDDTRQELTNANNQLTRYTDGDGVRAMLVVTTDIGTSLASVYYEYINQDDQKRSNSCQVDLCQSAIQMQIATSGTGANNHSPFLPLAPGDTGMKQLTSIQLSQATGAGWMCAVLVKPLMTIPLNVAGLATERSYITQTPSLPRVYDTAYLNFIIYAGAAVAAATPIAGNIQFIWGNA
jgi:hypothetical protein